MNGGVPFLKMVSLAEGRHNFLLCLVKGYPQKYTAAGKKDGFGSLWILSMAKSGPDRDGTSVEKRS